MSEYIVKLLIILACTTMVLAADVKKTSFNVSDRLGELKAAMQNLGQVFETASNIAAQKNASRKTLDPGDVTSVRTSVVFVRSGRRNYRVYREPELNFEEAFKWCRDRGMQLLSIETKEAYQALEQVFVGKETGDMFWTSGNDQDNLFSFVWKSTGNPFTFTKFYADDPNNGGGIERCVSVGRFEGRPIDWVDNNCEKKLKFVCEKF